MLIYTTNIAFSFLAMHFDIRRLIQKYMHWFVLNAHIVYRLIFLFNNNFDYNNKETGITKLIYFLVNCKTYFKWKYISYLYMIIMWKNYPNLILMINIWMALIHILKSLVTETFIKHVSLSYENNHHKNMSMHVSRERKNRHFTCEFVYLIGWPKKTLRHSEKLFQPPRLHSNAA